VTAALPTRATTFCVVGGAAAARSGRTATRLVMAAATPAIAARYFVTLSSPKRRKRAENAGEAAKY
jgi:hypothetical protein